LHDIDIFAAGLWTGEQLKLFYKNNLRRTRGSFCSKFKNDLSLGRRNNLKFSIEEQIFAIKILNKTAASGTLLAKYILLFS